MLVKSPINRNDKEIIIDQISNFVDEMRIQHDANQPFTSDKQWRRKEEIKERETDKARRQAEQLVIEAERFKASVEKPTGMENVELWQTRELTDDMFFHLLCHID